MMGFNSLSVSIILAPNGRRQEENASNSLFISYADEMYRRRIKKRWNKKKKEMMFN